MSLEIYTQAAASKKRAGLWIGLAIVTLAIFLMPDEGSPPVDQDVSACMLKDVIATPTFQDYMHKAGGIKPEENVLLESLDEGCASLNKEFLSFQKVVLTSRHLPIAAKLLQDLRNFDAQYDLAMSYREPAYAPRNVSDQNATSDLEWQRAQKSPVDSKLKRTVTRVCFLQLVTSARQLTASLPRVGGNANGALGCAAGMLEGIEEKAMRELEQDESASALSCLGVHWSVLSVSSSDSLFGSGPMPSGQPSSSSGWVQDYWGTLAPADMVHAEDLFSRSAQAHGPKCAPTSALSLVHAHRLKQHAKVLESHEQHSAAAKRYQLMAQLAEDGGSSSLSAYALSQLSLSLKMQGSDEAALVAAKGAVDLTMDPLAQFVLATVRLSSGLLTTEASMKGAERQLRAVAGQLPTDEMETQRAKMHSEMLMWRLVSDGNANKCLWTGDAARFLICAMCKLIF